MAAGCGGDDGGGIATGAGPSTSSRNGTLVTGSSTSSTTAGVATTDSTSQGPDTRPDTPPEPTVATDAPTTTEPVGTIGEGTGLPPEPPPVGEVTVGGGGAATGLAADPRCDPGDLARSLVTLNWTPSGSGEQRVVVSTRQDGLDSGNAMASAPLDAGRSTYQIRDSQPGGVYYWRVLTRSGDGWAASDTAQFEGPTCALF